MWEKKNKTFKEMLKIKYMVKPGVCAALRDSQELWQQNQTKSQQRQPHNSHPGEVRELCALHTPLPAVPKSCWGTATGKHHLTMHFQSPGLFGSMGRQAAPDAPCPVDIVTQDK